MQEVPLQQGVLDMTVHPYYYDKDLCPCRCHTTERGYSWVLSCCAHELPDDDGCQNDA